MYRRGYTCIRYVTRRVLYYVLSLRGDVGFARQLYTDSVRHERVIATRLLGCISYTYYHLLFEGELEELTGVLATTGGGALTLGGRHRPEELTTLAATTRFSRKEIQLIYRGFKQECPSGLVDEEAFKQIFSQFFPQGDASQYAHYVFNTMKRKQSGKISFEEFLTILSKVSRGSVEEKLQWVFGLYDLDGDGLISKDEMLDVVGSIYEMLGRYTQPQCAEPQLAAREHVERIFHLMDTNKDGVVTIEELVQWCSKDEQLLRSLDTLDTVL
ncbi:Kv channel-interacting protein 1-like isoform X1 [Neodiprion fabricii]|uniref:Kv channel-interacting protein 1-like isoform X1 n=1 Tax=Neodiprion fabricii TaxID=2872261 RepID=UPI001ED95777|nr:Kv channel-interacting protein 1-like isoform X1 [Neodiprion fabricii]